MEERRKEGRNEEGIKGRERKGGEEGKNKRRKRQLSVTTPGFQK